MCRWREEIANGLLKSRFRIAVHKCTLLNLCVAFCESGIRATRRPSRRYFIRINTFTAVFCVQMFL